MAEVRKGPVLGLVLVVVAGLAFGARYAINHNLVPGLQTVESSVPETNVNLRDFRSDQPAGVQNASTSSNFQLPSDSPTEKNLSELRYKGWAWQGQNSINLAIGGPVTTKGSLTEKYGVKVYIERQDDTNQLRNELYACAQELSSGRKDCSSGIHMTALMGDQLGAQLAGWNAEFRKLGEDLIIEKIGASGRSDGEDAFLAPPNVKIDKNAARGLVVLAAPREGDQNIVLFWADQNDIPVNVDQRTYDPDAINFMDAESYTKAAEDYNAKKCEPRAEVRKGVRTGKTVQACANALTTWTPADVVATVGENSRGGLVRIFSSHENSSQMPASILGIKRWNKDHAQTVVNFLAAVTEAGEQIRSSPAALRRSTEINAKLYGELGKGTEEEKDPRFWLKYYRGATETDAEGNSVQLGGSLAFTLADNLKYWGVNGGTDYYRDSYELFGGYMHRYYPNEVPSIEPYEQIANKSYIRAVARMRAEAAKQQATGVIREFEQGEEITSVSTRGSWTIEFETGQDTFTPAAARTLEELRRVLNIAQNELVRIEGHTDNVGNPAFNQDLSERRASAVKNWLQQQSRDAFPDNRLQVRGYGQVQPKADNSTAAGRALNRRVDIVLGR
jgi:OOP family OmpA-OmpF porin